MEMLKMSKRRVRDEKVEEEMGDKKRRFSAMVNKISCVLEMRNSCVGGNIF